MPDEGLDPELLWRKGLHIAVDHSASIRGGDARMFLCGVASIGRYWPIGET